MTNLIFCAVGNPILTCDDYDKDNHWRLNKPYRNYETVVCNYKTDGFEPDDNTYDVKYYDTGYKWQLVNRFLQNFTYEDYEYIGFFDDDVITDIQSLNRAFEIAKDKDFKLFQMSMKSGSESSHSILLQDSNLMYSRTNFVEGMGCIFHNSLIPILLDFWTLHECKTGWGLDIIFDAITKTIPAVIHEVSMFHPPADFKGYTPSYYNNSVAVEEMNHILYNVYPQFMKKRYNENTGPYTGGYSSVYETVYK